MPPPKTPAVSPQSPPAVRPFAQIPPRYFSRSAPVPGRNNRHPRLRGSRPLCHRAFADLPAQSCSKILLVGPTDHSSLALEDLPDCSTEENSAVHGSSRSNLRHPAKQSAPLRSWHCASSLRPVLAWSPLHASLS